MRLLGYSHSHRPRRSLLHTYGPQCHFLVTHNHTLFLQIRLTFIVILENTTSVVHCHFHWALALSSAEPTVVVRAIEDAGVLVAISTMVTWTHM